MAHTTMSLTEALGPLVDPLTRRQLLAHDLHNGTLPAARPIAPSRQSRGRTPESGVTYPGVEFLTILTNVIDDLWRDTQGRRHPQGSTDHQR